MNYQLPNSIVLLASCDNEQQSKKYNYSYSWYYPSDNKIQCY